MISDPAASSRARSPERLHGRSPERGLTACPRLCQHGPRPRTSCAARGRFAMRPRGADAKSDCGDVGAGWRHLDVGDSSGSAGERQLPVSQRRRKPHQRPRADHVDRLFRYGAVTRPAAGAAHHLAAGYPGVDRGRAVLAGDVETAARAVSCLSHAATAAVLAWALILAGVAPALRRTVLWLYVTTLRPRRLPPRR